VGSQLVYEAGSSCICMCVCQIRSNQGVTKDNLTTPPPPTFVPPVLYVAPWLFEVFISTADSTLTFSRLSSEKERESSFML